MTDQLTKAEGAAYLDCSTRTLERAAAKHSIQTTTRRNGSGRPEVVYNLSDLDLLKSDRSTPVVSGALVEETALVPQSRVVSDGRIIHPSPFAITDFFAQLATLPKSSVPLAEHLTLSLSEAVEYTGLTQNAINNAATRGKLKATHTRPRRYRPADLRAFVESL